MKDWILDHEVGSFCIGTLILMAILLIIAAVTNSASLAVITWISGAMLILGSPVWVLGVIAILCIAGDIIHPQRRLYPPHAFSVRCPCDHCKRIKLNTMYGIHSAPAYTFNRVHGDFDGEL